QMRADRIAHHVVSALSEVPPGSPTHVPLHLRDLVDILRYPSFTRVAPLAQVLAGHYHSPIKSDRPAAPGGGARAWALAGAYLLLKVFALIVLFVIPIAGIVVAYRKVAMTLDGWPLGVLAATGLVAVLCLIAAAIADSISVARLTRKLLNRAK